MNNNEADIKEVIKNRWDFFLKEMSYNEENEKKNQENIKRYISNPKLGVKNLPIRLNEVTWMTLIHEMEVLYNILYVLVEDYEKNIGKIDKVIGETELFRDKELKWVLQDIRRRCTELENNSVDGDKVD